MMGATAVLCELCEATEHMPLSIAWESCRGTNTTRGAMIPEMAQAVPPASPSYMNGSHTAFLTAGHRSRWAAFNPSMASIHNNISHAKESRSVDSPHYSPSQTP